MKHYSASTLERLAQLPRPQHELHHVVEHVRSLVITDGKAAVAKRLGVSEFRLTGILRGRWGLTDSALAALGYRKIVRFERID